MKLEGIKEIKATIVVKTGLHIGGNSNEIKIGGIDNPVIKNPFTNEPYIPGSSIKGKIRTLLEWYFGVVSDEKPVDIQKEENKKNKYAITIAKLFGNGATIEDLDLAREIGPTRISFLDCNLKNKEELLDKNAITEEKIEVSINRLTGTSLHPRHMERVPAGAEFNFSVTLMKFDDDKEDFERILALGMKLLELTNLGGNGSRGYGKIEFTNIEGLDDNECLDKNKNNRLKSYETLKNLYEKSKSQDKI